VSRGPVRLKYHQATFDMLGEKPVVSAEAVRKIAAWERRHRARLPGSLREWYSLEWAERKWTYEPLDYYEWVPAPLDEILQGLTVLRQGRKKSKSARLLIGRLDDEPMYFARLNGAADPAVFIGDERCSRGTLSVFLFRMMWQALPELRPAVKKCCLTATELAFSGMELDFLIDHFQEGPREIAFRGRTEMINPFTGQPMKLYPFRFCFYDRVGRVGIGCQADPAKGETEATWRIDARSKKALAVIAARVWPCGALSQTLSGATRQAKAVLKEFRSSP
jgi:hypothetical protein